MESNCISSYSLLVFYHNDKRFSESWVANNADLEQTDWSGYKMFAILSATLGGIVLWQKLFNRLSE